MTIHKLKKVVKIVDEDRLIEAHTQMVESFRFNLKHKDAKFAHKAIAILETEMKARGINF